MCKGRKVDVFELALKVYLLEDIPLKNMLEAIAKLIDKSLAHTDDGIKFHEENRFKLYNFNGFYPVSKTGVYEKGNIYTVKIRTIDESLADVFGKYLANEYTEKLKALTISKKIIPRNHIKKVYSITPCVIKSEDGYWKTSNSIEFFKKRLTENLIKKYNQYFDTKIDEDFQLFNFLEFTNHKPIATEIKGISLLGDKISLEAADNEMAQKLIYMALGTGLCEVNSRGYGFVNYSWL